jgi:hypothetical protein
MEEIKKYVLSTSGLIESEFGNIMLVEDYERIVAEIEKKAFEKGWKKGYGEGYKQAIVNF